MVYIWVAKKFSNSCDSTMLHILHSQELSVDPTHSSSSSENAFRRLNLVIQPHSDIPDPVELGSLNIEVLEKEV